MNSILFQNRCKDKMIRMIKTGGDRVNERCSRKTATHRRSYGIAVGNMTLAFTIPDLIALILDPSVKSCRMRMAWNHVEEWVMNQMNCIDGNWWFKKRDLSLEQTDMKERRRMIVRKWQEEMIETWKDLQTTIWSKEETVDETIESSEGMEEWRNSEDEISYGTCLTARSHPSDVKEH